MVVMVMEEEVEVMADDRSSSMMAINAAYLMIVSDGKEAKQHHILTLTMVLNLHYHDDVSMKMVQQISVYSLTESFFISRKLKTT